MSGIKATYENDIDDALHDMLGNVSWEVKRHLSQGASATIYQIECEGKSFIARISDPNRPNANVPLEFHCMHQASNCKVAPHLYYHSSKKNISIMEYIDAKPLPFLSGGNGQDIKKLADTIAGLHAGEEFPQSHSIFNMFDQISQLVRQYFSGNQYVENTLNKIPILKSFLDIEADIKPSHRDLHGFNVIYDGKRYYFIDWESAGNESLYFDLAVAVNMLLFKMPGSESLLLNAYFKGEPAQDQLAKLALMRVFAYLYYGVILFYLSASIQEPRLSGNEIAGLESFSKFLEKQVKENNPNMGGRFLRFGYSSLIEGIKLFETNTIKNAINVLSKVD